MFIVLNHILVATFLYHRNPSRFLTDKKCGWRSESKKRSCNCDGDGIDENSRSTQASYNKAKNYDDLNKQVCVCYNHVCENSSTATAVASSGQPSKCGLSDRGNAILSLCADLNDQEAALLQVKVIHYLKEQIQAECGFLLLLLHDTQELLCQVIGDKVLEEELRFHSDTDVFAKLRNHHTPVSHTDLDETSVQELESFLCRKVRSFLCVPVFTRQQGQPIALMCIVNKALPSEDFTESDTKTIQECFRYTATVLTSALAVQNERRLKNETQALLQVARNLFQHLDDLTMLLSEIIQEARNLTQAERCSVFLIDNETDELIAKVFDGVTKENNQVQMEIRIPITQGIAGHVATTGELLNIKDAYSHPLFYRGIDESTGFRTRNILCFPIKDEKDIVIGVAQLCNKKTSSHFTQFDEEIASAFSVYCCISIVHSLMYKKVIDAQSRNKLANELMMYHMKTVLYQKLQEANNRNKLTFEMMLYHMKVTNEDVNAFAQQDHPTPLQIDPEYALFTYSPRALPESETLTAIVSMAEELGFLSRWRIRRDVFSRFILMAKKGYRHPPYHNWMHAYAVTHFCYLLIHNLQLSNCLQEIEVFALFVACICHDIDHRGTNNSFQVASQSVLAALYSSEGSVLERHHFAQTMCILHTEGCNIFENLSCKDYQQVLDLMRDVILATDMAHHLRVLKNIETMAENGFDKTDNRHRKLLLCILMTSCDLSDQTKPWNNTKKIAALIYQEFFSQGDMEKSLGKSPIEMMDRERAEIPDLQISFLDYIAIPVYRVLSKLFPLVVPVLAVVESNKRQWERISEVMKQRNAPLTLDEMLALEDDEIDGILASNDDDNASISAAAS